MLVRHSLCYVQESCSASQLSFSFDVICGELLEEAIDEPRKGRCLTIDSIALWNKAF